MLLKAWAVAHVQKWSSTFSIDGDVINLILCDIIGDIPGFVCEWREWRWCHDVIVDTRSLLSLPNWALKTPISIGHLSDPTDSPLDPRSLLPLPNWALKSHFRLTLSPLFTPRNIPVKLPLCTRSESSVAAKHCVTVSLLTRVKTLADVIWSVCVFHSKTASWASLERRNLYILIVCPNRKEEFLYVRGREFSSIGPSNFGYFKNGQFVVTK